MESISDSRTSKESVKQINTPKIKAASAPIHPLSKPEETKLKVQISAPSYLFSLKDNEAPQFVKPGREPSPKLLIGTIINEDDVVAMIAAAEIDKQAGLQRFIGKETIRHLEKRD